MRQKKSKACRRQAEQWCRDFLMESFPEEVVGCTSKEELWNLAFPETHYLEVRRKTWVTDKDGESPQYTRMRLFKMSPRWIYKQLKKNPAITKMELKELAA